MSQSLSRIDDPRVVELLDVVIKFAAGDLKARATVPEDDSTLAGVMTGINMLGEELEASVAESKRAAQALSESEQELRTIFDTVQDGILVADAHSQRFVKANVAMLRMLGYAPGELSNLSVENLHPDKDIPRAVNAFERLAAGESGIVQALPMKRKDGTVFYADVNASAVTLRGQPYLLGVFRDITERRQVERALRQSEERFRSIGENMVEMFFIVDASRRLEYISPRCLDIYGYSAEEFLAGPGLWVDTVHPEDRPTLVKHLSAEVRSGARGVHEFRVVRKDGSVRWVRSVSNSILGAEGKPQRVYGSITDITESESLRSSLKEKEVLLKEIHHRVKNNLQIVISLMRLEPRAFADDRAGAVLKDLETRVRTMWSCPR